MSMGEEAAERVERGARRALGEARPWVERLGRAGYAAHGIVYGLVGLLAVQAAAGAGGATTDTQGALARVVDAPFGRFLLILIAVGLLGYALWRFVQAGLDPQNKGTDAKGAVTRAGYAVRGVVHVGLALSAARLARGGSGGDGEGRTRDLTASLLGRPLGQWLVGLGGLIVIGAGLAQLYRAYSAEFREEFKLGEMGATEREWVTRLGRIGYAARWFVFGIIGAFLLVAARQARPEEARGLGGALATLAAQPLDPWLLGLVAAGLVAYGLLMLAQARYGRVVIR